MKLAPLISLGLSAVLGIAAVFLGRYYMTSDTNEVAAQAPAAAVQMSSVLVAARAIEPGEEVSSDNVKTIPWPSEALPEGAVFSTDDLAETLYARTPILPGEPIMSGKLDAAANMVTLAAAIEPGMRAVSIIVRNDTGVSGFVLPGDRVDVNEFIEGAPGQTPASLGSDAVRVSGQLMARPVLRNVKVLAVDQTFESGLEGALPSNTVTLEVSPQDALRLGAAGVRGSLGLALIGRKEDAAEIKAVKTVARPRPRQTIAVRSAPKPPSTAEVRVINGDREVMVKAPVAQPERATEEQR